MTGLEQTFYIMAIIFMSLFFLMMIALVAAVFVIRSKINKIHAAVESKLNTVTTLAERGGEVAALASTVIAKKAKKAVKKTKR